MVELTKNHYYTMYLDKPSRIKKESRSQIYHESEYPSTTDIYMVGRGPQTNELCGLFHSGWKNESSELFIIKKIHCNHLACPKCYNESISLRTFSSTAKLKLYARAYRNLVFQHVSLNFIEKDITIENFYEWWNKIGRKKYNKIAKAAGLDGGIAILHLWRVDKTKKGWLRFSPHLHILGSGYLLAAAKFKARFGFTYRQHKKRFITQLDATFAYLLNHAAILKGKQVVRHFGVVANNKFRVEHEKTSVKFEFRKLMDNDPLILEKTDITNEGKETFHFIGVKPKEQVKTNMLGGWYQLKMDKISHGQFKISQTIRLMLWSVAGPCEYVFRRNGTFIRSDIYDSDMDKKIKKRNLGKFISRLH